MRYIEILDQLFSDDQLIFYYIYSILMDIFEFIHSDEVLKSLKKTYNTIIFDSQESDVGWALLNAILENKTILLVLEHSRADRFFHIGQNASHLTILNLSSWIESFGSVGSWNQWEVSQGLSFGFSVYEPIHEEQLLEFLSSHKWKNFIRTHSSLTHHDQLPKFTSSKDAPYIFSLVTNEMNWFTGTVIAFGNSSIQSIHAASILLSEGHGVDLFLATNYALKLSKDIKESLKKTRRLVIVSDQIWGWLYEYFIKWVLLENHITDIEVVFATPNYETITTILPEYIYEQAHFDWAWIASKIMMS